MRRHHSTFSIFHENELRELFQGNNTSITDKITRETENYILNVNEAEYIEFLVEEFTIYNLSLEFENETIESYEARIRAEEFPRSFYVRPGEAYPREVIVYFIPFSGNSSLLRCTPSYRILWTIPVFIEDNNLCFEIIGFSNDPSEITRQHDENVSCIKAQLEYVRKEVDHYNKQLPQLIGGTFAAHKKKILDKHNMLAALNVPLRKRTQQPQTFTIPNPETRKRISLEKPKVTEPNYKAEPTLNSSLYNDILKTLLDAGKGLERQPSTYKGKQEEDLRDLFLFLLQPQFEGSATGETFNKSGKTDILLRYENSNVFIAECKFWSGSKNYLETISQLLGYLTWRDSKAAVILFAKQRDFSKVLEQIEIATPTHPNYLGFADKREDTWFNYRLHINDDRNREVALAVLAFHLPQ